MNFRPITFLDAPVVAALHIEGIKTAFISSLGINFVTTLYEAITQSPYSFGYVAQENGKLLGFAAFTTNINSLYMSVIRKKGLRFAFLLAGKMFSLQQAKNIIETVFYPFRIKRRRIPPSAALLSIAVVPQERGRGIASHLLHLGFQECQKRGHRKVRVLVGADNEPANKLYLKCGFKLLCQIYNHKVLSNILIAEVETKLPPAK